MFNYIFTTDSEQCLELHISAEEVYISGCVPRRRVIKEKKTDSVADSKYFSVAQDKLLVRISIIWFFSCSLMLHTITIIISDILSSGWWFSCMLPALPPKASEKS